MSKSLFSASDRQRQKIMVNNILNQLVEGERKWQFFLLRWFSPLPKIYVFFDLIKFLNYKSTAVVPN
jgi:hypothetical protein